MTARQGRVAVEGMNFELDRAYFKVSFNTEMETMASQPYITLRLLATRPGHQRRGAGAMLLKLGLETADGLGLPVYLDSGVGGKSLYEHFGFDIVRDFPLNCLDYGGRSDGKHWSMLRPAKMLDRNAATEI